MKPVGLIFLIYSSFKLECKLRLSVLCLQYSNCFSDGRSAVTPTVFPPMTASSSHFNMEGVKDLSCRVCSCQCVSMFESRSNVRDCAYVCRPRSAYFHREVSERVKAGVHRSC